MEKRANKREQILKDALEMFALKGFYATTMPEMAQHLGMSPGNIYRYFSSKDELAYEVMIYSSRILGEEVNEINAIPAHSKEKIWQIVCLFLNIAKHRRSHIDFFIKVTVASKEIFQNKKTFEETDVVKAFHIFFEEGVLKRELRNQDFFGVLGLFIGYLSGIAYMYGENLLEEDVTYYANTISQNIYEALRIKE
ncbi:MAG: TetR/AcrR family transcriptional regulator [Campylobacteraceae bacterium]|nr:TetR/AcrR family transcriptional regulator [Campylobacteraceae bacterium]